MKKIGILTFQFVDNYGALLQAYALKSILLRWKCSAEILNYYCPKIQADYSLNIFKPKPHTLIQYFKLPVKLCLLPVQCYLRTRFAIFCKQYITNLPPVLPIELSALQAQYDLFITGSDQVFNPRITGFDANYFLAFSKDTSKNASYAASFGFELKDLSEQEKQFIRQNIPHLKHLSVREQQGAEIIHSLTGQTAQVHIDPTLLLTKTQWQELAQLPTRPKPYMLLYLMHKDPGLITFAKQLARVKNCQLLYVSTAVDIKNRVPATHITPTPQEWLGLFLHAAYVVTNSFHGLAFSINFNQTFFVGKLPASWPANSRLENLLSLTGLHNRVYTNFTDNYDKPIDWETVNEKLGNERKKSLAYLQAITNR